MNRDEMLVALAAQGYDVNTRQLTDWVGKGLLPRPPRPGRGRGKGRSPTEWDASGLTQAMVIADLFRVHYKARDVALILWLLGFQVSKHQVHESILKRIAPLSFLANIQASISHQAKTADDWTDGVSRWVAQIGDPVVGGPAELAAIPELLWQLLLNPQFRLTRDIVQEVQEEWQRVQGERIRQMDIWTGVRFVQQRLHISSLYATALTATPAEWDQARQTWLEIWHSGQQFSQRVGWSRREWRYIAYRFLYVAGPWIVTALLTLHHQGEEDWVRKTIQSITDMIADAGPQITLHPDPFTRVTEILEPRIQRIAEELAKPRRRRRRISSQKLVRRVIKRQV